MHSALTQPEHGAAPLARGVAGWLRVNAAAPPGSACGERQDSPTLQAERHGRGAWPGVAVGVAAHGVSRRVP